MPNLTHGASLLTSYRDSRVRGSAFYSKVVLIERESFWKSTPGVCVSLFYRPHSDLLGQLSAKLPKGTWDECPGPDCEYWYLFHMNLWE